jgi:hypothetical protein
MPCRGDALAYPLKYVARQEVRRYRYPLKLYLTTKIVPYLKTCTFFFFGVVLPVWIQIRIRIPKLDPDPQTQLGSEALYHPLLLKVYDICMCLGVCGVFGGEPQPGGAAGPGSPLHTDGALQLHIKVSS